MAKLVARDMLDWTEDEVWELDPRDQYDLSFDDGTINNAEVTDIQISWYFWQVSKFYSAVPVTKSLFLNRRPFTDKLARKMMNIAVQSARAFPNIDREDVWQVVYRNVYNRCFCALTDRLLPYISATNGDDVVELLLAVKEKEDEERAKDPSLDVTVAQSYKIVREIFSGQDYAKNPIVRAVSYSAVKLNQMLPSFGPKGSTTDIDSELYRIQIKRGFARGFTSIADFAKESRSAAKALLYNKDPVAIAEYFNRKLQFVSAYIKDLTVGDCGSQDYHTFTIPSGEAGKALLRNMAFMTKVGANGKLSFIDPDDDSQLGKTINFRSTMTCLHLKDGAVCETCYGDMSYSIPNYDNPGHVSCTALVAPLSQLIISTKHLDFIIHNLLIRVSRKEESYLSVKPNVDDKLFLNKSRDKEPLVMRVFKTEAPRLIEVRYLDDPSMMNQSRIAQLTYMELHHVDPDGEYTSEANFNMVKQSTKACFSREMLLYMKRYGWSEDDAFYTIDLSKWNVKDPMFTYPHKHENMSEYGKRVERFIRSTREAGERNETKKGHVNMLTKYKDVDSALLDAYYLISDKIPDVYVGHIAAILAATRVKDAEAKDFSFPSSMHEGSFQTHDDIIRYSSLGVAMLYEGHRALFSNIDSYVIKDRKPSILDDLVHLEEGKYPAS